jgi:hypothetical protein
MTYNMTGVRRQLKLKLRNCLLIGNLPTQRQIMCERPGRMTGSQGSRCVYFLETEQKNANTVTPATPSFSQDVHT